MADTRIVVPMLGRPHTVRPLVESIEATSDAVVLFVVSPEDRHVHHAIDELGYERITVEGPFTGDYARKINAGYRHTTEPLLFCGACDLRFHSGWVEACERQLKPGIGVVGTNDLGSTRVMNGEHSTHSLVTRDYADRGTIDGPGILHEGYPHEFVDDELVATAKHRNAWAFAVDARIEHLHPNWNKAPSDALYEGQYERMRKGRRLYRRRRHMWM